MTPPSRKLLADLHARSAALTAELAALLGGDTDKKKKRAPGGYDESKQIDRLNKRLKTKN